MDLSVIICTYNRAHYLKGLLQRLFVQRVPQGLQWEILIVDNNSVDSTSEVVKRSVENSPVPLRYLREAKQGLSYARNKGITVSEGRYLVFIDDDAIPQEDWVSALYRGFQRYGCDFVAGRIYLKSETIFPSWLTKELWGFLGFLDYGTEPFLLDEAHPPFGGNFAIARVVFEEVGLFDPSFGRRPGEQYGGEEYDLFLRLLKATKKGYYLPDAVVYHIIEKHKLTKRYFRLLHYYEGRNNGKSYDLRGGRHISGIPLFVFPQLIRAVYRYLRRPTLRMQMNIFWYLGFIRGRLDSYMVNHG